MVGFISVSKNDDLLDVLKPSVLTGIMEHYSSGKPILRETDNKNEISDDDNDTIRQIKELIDQRVRPTVAMDGGDMVFVL